MENTNRFQLRIEHLWAITVLAGIFIFVNTHPIRQNDFWWHITIGREISTTGKIPTTDIYSYTENGQPYPSYQIYWLMELSLYYLYKVGGPALVVFFYSIIITSAYGILFWISKQISNSWRVAAFSILLAAALGLNDWNVRPQGITFFLGSVFLLAIYQYKKQQKPIWLFLIPLGMLIWVNSHGTFLIGLGLVGIWLIEECWSVILAKIQHYQVMSVKGITSSGIVFIITALICLVNPSGLGVLRYINTLTSNSTVQNLVTEWAPPSFNSLMGRIFFIGLIISAGIMVLSPKRPTISQIITFLLFGLLGVRTSRGSVWFGLVMAPILAQHLSLIIGKLRTGRKVMGNTAGSRIVNYFFVSIFMMMVFFTLPWFKNYLPFPQAKAGLISSDTPVIATQFLLQENPPKQIFNGMSFGSYLIWAAYPKYQVFVDPRIELYPEKVWLDYLLISNAAEGWEKLLNQYEVNTLMISTDEEPALIKAVQSSNHWILKYQDQVSYIFVRNFGSQPVVFHENNK